MEKSYNKNNKNNYYNNDIESIQLIDTKFKKVKNNILSLRCKLITLTFLLLIILFL